MSYCPIYKGECPEDTDECTFWCEKIIPSHRTKKCDNCGGDSWDCDYCDGIVDERIIKRCTLRTQVKNNARNN